MKKTLLFSFVLATSLFASKEFEATLTGHALLREGSFIDVPSDAPDMLKVNGKFAGDKRSDKLGTMEGMSNGRPTGVMYPFEGQPRQGHSGILSLSGSKFVIITDNGLGNKKNSKDSMLYYNFYDVDFKSGEVKPQKTVFLKDPDRIVDFLIVTEGTKERYLTGGDFDPESIQFVGDFVYIGEEFGPYVIKTDKDGNVIKIIDTIVDGKVIKSPDNPALILPSTPDAKMPEFQVKRSKGFEGMASSPDGSRLYPLLEGALYTADAKKENQDGKDFLRILELDTTKDEYTGKSWKYILEDNANSIGDFNMIDEKYGLIIERDDTEGTMDKACKNGDDTKKCFDNPAKFKRIYKVELTDDGVAKKIAYIDLMNIKDPNKFAKKPLIDGKFVFPFFTIENVDIVGENHIVVGNDNNYPKSSSREPNKADDNELILLEVAEFLKAK